MKEKLALEYAIAITKEYGKGGYSRLIPDELLEKLYNKILELSKNDQS